MTRHRASLGWFLVFLVLWAGVGAASDVPVLNRGFETPPFPAYPGYSTTIPDWTAAGDTGMGVNPPASGGAPFLNGLVPPEGTHVGFIQNNGATAKTISQTLNGFQVGKTYYVVYLENERGVSSGTMARLQVDLGGTTVVPNHSIWRTPWFPEVVSSPFTATATSHVLEIIHPGSGSGDNSALFDNIRVVTRGIDNYGFEDLPVPLPYPGYSTAIPSWTASGNTGINPADGGGAPFLNGLTPPQGTHAGFIQASGTLSQMIGGFEAGKQYILQYAENERGLTDAVARLTVRLGGQTIVPNHTIVRTPQWQTVVSDPFTATSFAHLLEVQHPGGGTGDNTALFDNLLITRADLHVNNQGFEEGPLPGWPGYGPIQGWYGGKGINDASGPFVNGLPVPEGTRVAFMQSSGTMRQTIVGLEPGKQYIVQYYENERGLSGAVAKAEVRINGTPVVPLHDVTWTPRFVNVAGTPFTASGTSALLEVVHPGGGTGDNTLLVDGIYVTELGVPFVKNHNFEAAATFGGPGNYYSDIQGWLDPVGTPAGVARPSPHHTATRLNGSQVPEGTQVGFIQGGGSISQLAVGLVPGKQYILQYFENSRYANNTARLEIKLGGQTVVPNHVVGKTPQFRTVVGTPFTATSTAHLLEVIHPGGGIGDNTALFDQVLITEAGVPFLKNPGFEDEPIYAWPGYGRVSQWNSTGSCGTNHGAGPFVNGLPIPEGNHVGLLQRNGSLSQTVVGLIPGKNYIVEYYQNERGVVANAAAGPSALVDGNPVVDQMELIRTPQFRRVLSRPFTATDIAAVLELRNTSIQGDNTLLLDKVSVREVGHLVLHDSFDLHNNPATPHIPANSLDINASLGTRQAGYFAGTRYVETPHSAGGDGDYASQVDFAGGMGFAAVPDALVLGANAGLGAAFTAVSPSQNLDLGGMHIDQMVFEFDVDPYLPGSGQGDNWASFRFGDGAPVQYVAAAGSGFGILFRESGMFQAFDGSTPLGSGQAFDPTPGFHAIRLEVDLAAFDGSPATIRVMADGSPTPFFTYLKQSGFLDNYVTLGGYSGANANMAHGFDNLMIYTASIPEPTSAALLALAALGTLACLLRQRAKDRMGN